MNKKTTYKVSENDNLQNSRCDNVFNFTEIILIIEKAKAKIYKAVNKGLIDMYWEVGEYISRKVTQDRWGESTIQEFSGFIQAHYPDLKGFSPQNLWRMRQFYETYQNKPILSPLVRELTWSNNLLIMANLIFILKP